MEGATSLGAMERDKRDRSAEKGGSPQLAWLTLDMLKSGTRSAGIAVRGK